MRTEQLGLRYVDAVPRRADIHKLSASSAECRGALWELEPGVIIGPGISECDWAQEQCGDDGIDECDCGGRGLRACDAVAASWVGKDGM